MTEIKTLEQAARQALDALQAHADIGINSEKAIAALRYALSDSVEQPNLNCKSVQKRLATAWGYVKAEQQEPVEFWNAVDGWVAVPTDDDPKPVAWVYPEFFERIAQSGCWTAYAKDGNGKNSDGVKRIPLYTHPAPRRLTFQEIDEVCNSVDPGEIEWLWSDLVKFARAIEARILGSKT